MSNEEQPKIEPTKIHFGADLVSVKHTLNGKPFLASAFTDETPQEFKDAMKALIPHAILIKELPEKAGEDYRCNVLSLTCVVKEEGENRTALICLTKTTTAGMADNLSTPKRYYVAINQDVNILPEKTILAIREARRQAILFIEGNRDLKKLYSQEMISQAERLQAA